MKLESGCDLEKIKAAGIYTPKIKKETTENEHRVFLLTVYKDWIPCIDRMPEKHVEVLAYSPYWGKIVVAMWGGEFWLEQWTDDDLEQSEITHWMYLPEPPEGGADDAT